MRNNFNLAGTSLSVMFLLVLLYGCDASTEADFKDFCETNTPPLPAERVVTEGVEFRGDFNLYRAWNDFAEYVEFDTAKMPGADSFGYSELRPGALSLGRYRMELFDQWGEPCQLYFKVRRWPANTTAASYREELAANHIQRCQGIVPIMEFESEHVAEHIVDPEYALIGGRKVSANIYRVSVRKSGVVLGEFRYFSIPRHPLTPNLPEFSQSMSCGTYIPDSEGYVSDLRVFFERRNRQEP